MRSTNDNPIDPLGQIGKAIKPAAPSKPDTVKPFETGDHSLIGNTDKVIESIAETLRKKPEATPGSYEDWGCDLSELARDPYAHGLI